MQRLVKFLKLNNHAWRYKFEVYRSIEVLLALLTRTSAFLDKSKILFETDMAIELPVYPKTIDWVDC
jgi:hypothetical protein